MPRSKALPMDDAYTTHMTSEGGGEERSQRVPGLRDRQPMQVQLAGNPVFAPPQLAKHALRHARPPEGQLIAARNDRIDGSPGRNVLQHGHPIGAGKAGPRRATTRRASRLIVPQRLDVAHRFTKQVRVLLVQLLLHATSAEGHSVYLRRLLKAPPNATS